MLRRVLRLLWEGHRVRRGGDGGRGLLPSEVADSGFGVGMDGWKETFSESRGRESVEREM